MLGLMQSWPLTVDRILDHAAREHPRTEIVTRTVEGPVLRLSYAALHGRAKQVSHGLMELNIGTDDRVATLALNSNRHMEVWYGTMSVGAICHTLNPRMHPDQLGAVIRHAGDRLVFTDPAFVPLLKLALAGGTTAVEHVVVLALASDEWPAFEPWIAGRPDADRDGAPVWGGFDEETACGLCYTSGTTGDPKGVLYSHRSNFLHTLMALQPDALGISATDIVMPIVPMFHANAWGTIFAAPAGGAGLVLPGPRLDGASLHELMEQEGVTMSLAVPTVFQTLLEHLDATRSRLTTLKRVVIGGSACPESLVGAYRDRHGVEVRHAWGMTELSPIGTLAAPKPQVARAPANVQARSLLKQGRPPLGVEMVLKDDQGEILPRDGKTVGRLMVRGFAIAGAYYRGKAAILDGGGWFDTGDLATIDPDGFMRITDRSKDLVKSGGEWISSTEIEMLVAGHPDVANVAVIARPDPQWGERPLLIVQARPDQNPGSEAILNHLRGKIANWWMPDEVIFVDEIALGATGKVDKKSLRERYAVAPDRTPDC